MSAKILLIDNDANTSDLIRIYLENESYEVKTASNGEDGLNFFKIFDPAVVILELVLPKKDGLQVCREIREISNCPIIFLSSKKDVFDKVLGLELGADDYITKPFDMKELFARIKSVIRRSNISNTSANYEVVKYENMEISLQRYELKLFGKPIDIPPKELELLFFLASNPNCVYTRSQLLDKVWGFDYLGDSRTVDVHVKRLREKLDGVSNKWTLKTVWGVGYKFETIE